MWVLVLLLVAMFARAASAQVSHPDIEWSTFLAGSVFNPRTAVDSQGNIYVFGTADSSRNVDGAIPTCPQTSCRDEVATRKNDLYIAKISPDGSQFLWRKYIGGSDDESLAAVFVSPSGEVYLAGSTRSADFPVTPGALLTVFPATSSGQFVGFIMRLDANGDIRYSTFIDASPSALSAEAGGELIFTGGSSWTRLTPTPGALALGGNQIIARLSADGSRILMAARGIGGSLLARDTGGNFVVAGAATPDYPTTAGAFQTTARAFTCGSAFFVIQCGHQYVSKVSADGSKLMFSTFVSGISEMPLGLAVDQDDSILLGGGTQSGDYPVTAGAFQTTFRSTIPGGMFGGINAFNGYVTRLAPDGSALMWSTLIGGRGLDIVDDLKLGPDGSILVSANLTLFDFQQLDSLGQGRGGMMVAAFSSDGSSVTAARAIPGTPSATATLFRSSITVDSSGSIVFSTMAPTRSVLVSPGVVSVNPDLERVTSGAYVVKMNLSRAGSPAESASLVDAADLAGLPAVAPGQLVTLFAADRLGSPSPFIALPEGGVYPKIAAGTEVFFDGQAAPILYTASDQVNAAVPSGVEGQLSTLLTVAQDGVTVHQRVVPVVRRAPVFFMPTGDISTVCTIDGHGFGGAPVMGGVINNEDGTRNSCTNPAKPGSVVEFFLNGIGPADTGLADGAVNSDSPPPLTVPLVIQLNGQDIQPVSATGAPGAISGVWRIRVQIPSDFPSNMAGFKATIDGVPVQPSRFYAWVAH